MPRLTTMYAGASGSHRGNNFMSGGMCNNKWQGLPATRNMRTGPLLTHVRTQAYAPPADRNRIFNALGGQVLRKYPNMEYTLPSKSRFADLQNASDSSLELTVPVSGLTQTKLEEHNSKASKSYYGCIFPSFKGGHYTYLSEIDIYNILTGLGYDFVRESGSSSHIDVLKSGVLKGKMRFSYRYVFKDLNNSKQIHIIRLESTTPNSEKANLIDKLYLNEIGNGGTC